MNRKYQINTIHPDYFAEVINKLFEVGFVYSSSRNKTIEDVIENWGFLPIILFGNCSECKMVLHGDFCVDPQYHLITVDEFLTNVFPNW